MGLVSSSSASISRHLMLREPTSVRVYIHHALRVVTANTLLIHSHIPLTLVTRSISCDFWKHCSCYFFLFCCCNFLILCESWFLLFCKHLTGVPVGLSHLHLLVRRLQIGHVSPLVCCLQLNFPASVDSYPLRNLHCLERLPVSSLVGCAQLWLLLK